MKHQRTFLKKCYLKSHLNGALFTPIRGVQKIRHLLPANHKSLRKIIVGDVRSPELSSSVSLVRLVRCSQLEHQNFSTTRYVQNPFGKSFRQLRNLTWNRVTPTNPARSDNQPCHLWSLLNVFQTKAHVRTSDSLGLGSGGLRADSQNKSTKQIQGRRLPDNHS